MKNMQASNLHLPAYISSLIYIGIRFAVYMELLQFAKKELSNVNPFSSEVIVVARRLPRKTQGGK